MNQINIPSQNRCKSKIRPESERRTKATKEPVPHESAEAHVSGEALYVDDLPFSPNEVWVDYIASPVAHGVISGEDYEELRQLPSILGIYTYRDLPGRNAFGNIIADEPFLPEKEVH